MMRRKAFFLAAALVGGGLAAAMAVWMPWGARGIDYPENSAFRVASFPAEMAWVLQGEDAGRFRIAEGVLRFSDDGGRVVLPDFELPRDADGDNRYEVTVRAGGENGEVLEHELVVRVTDQDEPGQVEVSAHRPGMGEAIRAAVMDPDGIRGELAWRWERWNGAGAWIEIPGGTRQQYTPSAADTGQYLRVTAIYADRHGESAPVRAFVPNPVRGPRLRDLEARTDNHRDARIKPDFDPDVLHYAIPCEDRDVLTLSFALPPDVSGRFVSVDGIQPFPGEAGGAAVAVDQTRDVTVTVSTPDGAATDYTIHCMPQNLATLETHRPEGAPPFGELITLSAGSWAAVVDEHAVPRFHREGEEDRGISGFFLRPFLLPSASVDPRTPAHARDPTQAQLRWAYGISIDSEPRSFAWIVLDREFESVRTVTTAPPMKVTGRHDFRILDDGAMLLMAYEPAVRDLSGLEFPPPKDEAWGTEMEAKDSVIQILNPDGSERWTWNSWGQLPLEDCSHTSIPQDYAHVNSLQWIDTTGVRTGRMGVLASFRSCSSILMIDAESGIASWRIGQTNLTPEDWRARGELGPPPMRLVGDPEGAFCGQHAAQFLPNGHLLLFDNGAMCVNETGTGKPLTRKSDEFSRVVEYALDYENGEAVFVRAHSLGGDRSHVARSGGHVTVLENGDWLTSWGSRLEDAVTRVEPATGETTFALGRSSSGGDIRALAVSPLVLARPRGALTAKFPDIAPAGHPGPGGRIRIAVAFSRPVKAFGPGTESIEVEGGQLVGVEPRIGFGLPANSYVLVLAPGGEEPVTLRLLEEMGCKGEDLGAEGICAADGTTLSDVPGSVTIEFSREAEASVR